MILPRATTNHVGMIFVQDKLHIRVTQPEMQFRV